MPPFVFRFAAATSLLASLATCTTSKKDDPVATPPAGINWTVDGSNLSTTTVQSQKFTSTISVAGSIRANANPTYLSLEFPNAVGTYTFSPTSNASASYTVSAVSPEVYYAGASASGTVTGAGTIVVTALSATNVTGTFTFTGIDTNTGAAKSIRNGTFNVGL